MTEQEAQTAFGNGGLLWRNHQTSAILKSQIVGTSYGNVIHLGEHEYTIKDVCRN